MLTWTKFSSLHNHFNKLKIFWCQIFAIAYRFASHSFSNFLFFTSYITLLHGILCNLFSNVPKNQAFLSPRIIHICIMHGMHHSLLHRYIEYIMYCIQRSSYKSCKCNVCIKHQMHLTSYSFYILWIMYCIMHPKNLA